MTDKHCAGNLAGRTEDFLSQVAFSSLSGAVSVLKSCQQLLPFADDLKLIKRSIEAVSSKAFSESSFPSRKPPNWWAEVLAILDFHFFEKIITAMKKRGAKSPAIASALIEYTEQVLRESKPSDAGIEHRELLQSIVSLFPNEKSLFPISFLCFVLRCAISIRASSTCRSDLEKRISAILQHATADDLLMLSFNYEDGEKLFDLDSIRRIITGFVEKEKSVAVFNAGDFKEICSGAMQRVAKTVDAYLAEIAADGELSISKFNGVAILIPKGARKVDDDLYRAVDVFLKAHPKLDEVEREKACNMMDPLKLSYEARVHASQNNRLPVQIVLHALYYDQLKLRSGSEISPAATATADVSLARENEELRTELIRMKMYISDLQSNKKKKNVEATTWYGSGSGTRKPTFLSSVSKKLSKLNPFKHGSKDTSNIDDGLVDVSKPRNRRFSIS